MTILGWVTGSFFNNNESLSASKKYIKINIIKKFKELKLFTPSIKLKPLIKTKKKNDIINGFRKEFCIILFNQFILVSIVMSGVSDIKKNIINNWNTNLNLGDVISFKSENIPNKIKKTHVIVKNNSWE